MLMDITHINQSSLSSPIIFRILSSPEIKRFENHYPRKIPIWKSLDKNVHHNPIVTVKKLLPNQMSTSNILDK